MSVHKSPYDEKDYRVIKLANGLTALLVSESKLTHPKEDSDSSDEAEEIDDEPEDTDTYIQTDSCSKRRSHSHSCSSEEKEMKKRGKVVNCAACGLCIRIGSFRDPLEVPGLAHLLEHMLFMGSEKYPGENEFDKFISQHGGTNDACTDYETTIFHFDVNTKVFKEALDRFAHFFVSPLLAPSSLEREIEAVDSEFQTSVQSDSHRTQQLFCSLAVPGHPLTNFPWGNSNTLKKSLQEHLNLSQCLREFYHKYYSASCMTVAVVSEDSLDTLEEYVRDSFSVIPTHGHSNPSIAHCQPVFDDSVFHQLYKVVPVKTIHYVSVSWILPCLLHEYRAKPTNYLGWLLGHEGYGSILSHLKKRNLATEILAGTGGEDYEMNSCFTIFSCQITLTEEGVDNVFECLKVVFQYLKMLQELGPQKRIYDELKAIEENEFNFSEEEDPMDLAERLCVAMQFYTPEDYLCGDDLYMEYKSDLISSITDLLVPNTCNIMVVSPKFDGECSLREKWFGTRYSHQAISEEWSVEWSNLPSNPELFLPPSNSFIASEFSLIEPDLPQSKYPVCIEDTPTHKLWYKKDDVFKLPRASVSVLFVTPLHFENVESAVLMELFVRLYISTLMELGYEAKVAQLDYSLAVAYRGLSLSMSGLHHKLPNLFERLVDHFSKFTVTEDEFKMVVGQTRRSYVNLSFRPAKICKLLRLQIIEKHHFPVSLREKTLDSLTFEHYRLFVEDLRSKLYVEALVQGNLTAMEAKELMKFLFSCIKCEVLPKELQYSPKCLRLPSNTSVAMVTKNKDPDSPNTVLTDYYQCSVADPREAVMAQLLVSCMEEPCFDSLRTKQQLGYTVYVTMHETHNITGLSINIITQATKFSTEYVSQKMDEFISGFLSELQSWSEDDFQSHVDALIDDLEEDDNCLDDEVSRNWGEVLTQLYVFDRLEKQVQFLKRISKTKACKWLQRYTHPGENYRRLSIKVVGNPKAATSQVSDTMSCNGVLPNCLASDQDKLVKQVLLGENNIPSFKSTLKQYPRGTLNKM